MKFEYRPEKVVKEGEYVFDIDDEIKEITLRLKKLQEQIAENNEKLKGLTNKYE